MQKEYIPVNGLSEVFGETREQLIESELTLPEYYPEISKVLKCCVTAGVEDVAQAGDKVSVAGKADIKLIYLDPDKKINVFTSLVKYTRVFSVPEIKSEDAFFVRQTLNGTEHRVTAPRRCEIRAAAAVKLTCLRKTEINVLSLPECTDAEVLYGELNTVRISTVKRFELAFSENTELPDTGSKICGVLYSSARLNLSETRVIKNKVMLKGSCTVEARFITQQGSITPEAEFNIPFTEIAGLPGAEENDEAAICAENVNARLAVSEDGRTAQVFVTAQIKAVCSTADTVSLPEDIYSVKREVKLERAVFGAVTELVPAEHTFSVSADAECYDDSASGVTAYFTDSPECSLVSYDGRLNAVGSVCVNFLISGADGISLISRSCSFEENTGITGCVRGEVGCSARIVSAELKNGRIRYTLNISMSGWCVKNHERGFITDAELENGVQTNGNSEKIVLYYAHPGEKIWDIAKENGCSAAKIKNLNDLTGESVEESRMLVLVR